MAEKTKQYLLVVVEFDASRLTDTLPYAAIPDEIGAALDDLTHVGALDTKTVYLLSEEQKDRLTTVINHNSLPYPVMLAAASQEPTPASVAETMTAVVVNLHDRRRRAESSGGNPRTV